MPRSRGDAGRLAAAIGAEFEKSIANKLAVAEQQGLVAWWQHNQPSYRKRGGQFFPAAASGADFSGMLRGSCAFALECKSTFDERFYLSKISDLQVKHLAATSAGGGLALLALQFMVDHGSHTQVIKAAMHWTQAPWERAISALSITPAGLAREGHSFPAELLAPFVVVCPHCRSAWPEGPAARNDCTCGSSLRAPF